MSTNDVDAITPAQEVDRWRNRKIFAYTCLGMIIAASIYAMGVVPFIGFTPDKLQFESMVITWLYTLCSAIIGAYIGAATVVHIKSGNGMFTND